MKFNINERVKHRLVGLVVILSLATVFLPAILKQSKYQFDEKINLSIRLPAKPKAPQVEVPQEKKIFESIEVAHVDLTPASEISRLPQSAKAEPLHPKNKRVTLNKKKEPIKTVKKTPVTVKTASKHAKYAVQLASFSVKKNAASLVSKLQKNGYKATYNKFSGQKGDYYKVIVGETVDPVEAKKLQKQLAEQVKLQGLVIKTGVS